MKYIKSSIRTFLILPALLLLFAGKAKAQCEWDIATDIDSSRCAASGTITVSLTGPNAGAVSNILYSLEPLTSGGYSIPAGTSPDFENIPAGGYRVVVTGVCNNEAVSKSKDVTVPGNYVQFSASGFPSRPALFACNSGQVSLSLQNGRKPYTIEIVSYPAAYTGQLNFSTTANSFVVDSLNAGAYVFTIKDACNTTAAQVTGEVTSLTALVRSDLVILSPQVLNGACDSFLIRAPYFTSNSIFSPYLGTGYEFKWSFSFQGSPARPYKTMVYTERDTLKLPAGMTAKDTYGQGLTYYIQFPCGQEYTFTNNFATPYLALSPAVNCAIDFTGSYVLYNNVHCLPVYTTLINQGTSQIWRDTITHTKPASAFAGLPFGAYSISSTFGDGHTITSSGYQINPPPDNPYYAQLSPNGSHGNDGAMGFTIIKSTGNLVGGTTIELVSPSNYTYFSTLPSTSATAASIPVAQSPYPNYYFGPGEYLFRVTDTCGIYDVPIVVEEKDVYRYNFTYTQEQTCGGLKIIPTGTAALNNITYPAYFKIVSGPPGYDPAVVPSGGALMLPSTGTYKIAMSANSTYVFEYSPAVNAGNGANVKIIEYVHKPLAVDVNRTIGWICPGGTSNSGSIAVYGINGSTAETGTYTFRLAAEGNGGTGPYLATNTTGRFSTATSGGAYTLMVNQNYDVRVEDECGAAAVQTIKIIDFATAQVASADKEMYCVGDIVRFKVINLPTTAITYNWGGPNNFTSAEQNPVITSMTAAHAGTYYVEISADICTNSIHDTVTIDLAPYVVTCYSAVTDTSVNPYTYGLLGNWRTSRTYAYYGARKESDPSAQTDIRRDGAYNDFVSFWQMQQGKWKAQQDTTRWVWNAESTLFNRKGFELENKDPLGRYNSAIYGYDNTFAVAVVQNSRYQETAYDGFEDYGFTGNVCDTGCAADRRFDFSPYVSHIDSAQHHTGRYSLRVSPGDTVGIVSQVSDTAVALTAPSFNMGTNACSVLPVLSDVAADKGVLLPGFTPLSGKKVLFSIWLKEDQDCNCTSYTNTRIDLVVSGPSGSTTIPVTPQGAIIEGWQRCEQIVELPVGATALSVVLIAGGTANVYFDDIRIHPYNANMKTFVYDPFTLRMMAELDENNYATFFEYDDDGTLTRVKKETERGVKTIKETRSALIKE